MSTLSLADTYTRLFPVIRAKCARILESPEEAADVAQETFIRLWQDGVAGAGPEATVAWIHRTATRLAVDRLRENRTRADARDPLGDQDDVQELRFEESIDARRSLKRIARKLSKQELAVAVLYRVDGLDQEQVASVLSVSIRTVRRNLKRIDESLEKLGKLEGGR